MSATVLAGFPDWMNRARMRFGWSVRTLEAMVRPDLRSERWGKFAYRNWLRLYRLDQAVLYRLIPKRAFYNMLLYAERPGG